MEQPFRHVHFLASCASKELLYQYVLCPYSKSKLITAKETAHSDVGGETRAVVEGEFSFAVGELTDATLDSLAVESESIAPTEEDSLALTEEEGLSERAEDERGSCSDIFAPSVLASCLLLSYGLRVDRTCVCKVKRGTLQALTYCCDCQSTNDFHSIPNFRLAAFHDRISCFQS